ncbi:MAG: tRNA (adenosine(37)-N6)-threonylcarbamoyltransferase complex dimerization subunit type 1 TsaB [Deferrisomatales bacterium]
MVLALDTAGETAGAAVAVDGVVRAQCVAASASRHAERVMGLVEAVLAGAGVGKDALSCVAVSRGPGSFTGLRVGVATAKGLAVGLGLPAVGISTLRALAEGARPFPGRVVPVLDAKKRQVYGAAFDGISGEVVQEEGAWDPEALARGLAEGPAPCLFLGSGLRPYREVFAEALGSRFLAAPPERWAVPPAQIARLGHEEFVSGGAMEPALLLPVYHRRSEAEEKRRSGAGARAG